MPTEQFEGLAKRLADFAHEVLDDLKAKELAASGFVRRAEINIGFGVVEPHIGKLAESLLDRIYEEWGKLSVADLMHELEARRAEKAASP